MKDQYLNCEFCHVVGTDSIDIPELDTLKIRQFISRRDPTFRYDSEYIFYLPSELKPTLFAHRPQ